MKQFMEKDFLLTTNTAKELFQSAAGLPILEYRSRLDPDTVTGNFRFDNIAQLWLSNAPDKWQLMRNRGVDEYYITGDASDYEKFQKWAETVPYLIAHPIYRQIHLELQRHFGSYEPLSPATAEQIWNRANAIITRENFTPSDLFRKFNVQVICTEASPENSLEAFRISGEDNRYSTKILPIFSVAPALNLCSDQFLSWLEEFGQCCSSEITDYFSFQSCLVERLLYFRSVGAVSAVQEVGSYESCSFEEAAAIFQKALEHKAISREELVRYRSNLLCFLGKKYADYNVVMMLDAKNPQAANLLYDLAKANKFPKTVWFGTNLNHLSPAHLPLHKLRIGLTQKDILNPQAVEEVFSFLLENGILSQWIGMSASSGDLLSPPMHELFRRFLCNRLAQPVENGDYPRYPTLLKKMAIDMIYHNSASFFHFPI